MTALTRLGLHGGPRKALAPAGTILSVTIPDKTTAGHSTDGWYCDVIIKGFKDGGTYDFGLGTDNDPTNAKFLLTITDLGFDATGAATTVQRTLYGVPDRNTGAVRKRWPNETEPQETESGGNVTVRIALSDFVAAKAKAGAGNSGTDPTVTIAADWYTDDGVDGSSAGNLAATDLTVTNNSTTPYAKAFGRWTIPPYQRIESTLDLECVAFHRSGNAQKPVACVQFDAADQSANSITTQTVATQAISTWGETDALPVPTYSASVATTPLNDTEVIDCNFKVYPWIGDDDAVFDSRTTGDGVVQPDERPGPLHLLLDKGDTLREYAFVATTGTDPGTTSATRATAKADPYLTIKAAAESFSAGKVGVVVCEAGSHTWTNVQQSGSSDAWTIIEPETGVSATVFGGNNTKSDGKIAIHGMTIDDNNVTGSFRGDDATNSLLWFHNLVDIDFAGFAAGYEWQCRYHTQCQSATDLDLINFSTHRSPDALARGNDWSNSVTVPRVEGYCVVGNKRVMIPSQDPQQQIPAHAQVNFGVVAYNEHLDHSNAEAFLIGAGASVPLSNFAVVGNLSERTGTTTVGDLQIAGDSSVVDCNHIIIWNNTIVGARANLGYNSTGSVAYVRNNWSQRGNIFHDWNTKGDDFGGSEDSNRDGNWPVSYNVGGYGNCFNTQNTINGGFRGDFDGLNSSWATLSTFVSDQSVWGTGTGNGDYHLQAGDVAEDRLPSFFQGVGYDLEGNLRDNPTAAGALRGPAEGPSNTAPLLYSIEGTALEYTEGDGAVQVTNTIGVADADMDSIVSAQVWISSGFAGAEDVLDLTESGGITGSYATGTGILTLSGSSTVGGYQTVLRSITYENTSSTPDETARVISFRVNDGMDNSNVVTRTVNVTAITPIVETLGQPVETDEAKAVSVLAGTPVVEILSNPNEVDESKAVAIVAGSPVIGILAPSAETDEAKAVSILAGTPIVGVLSKPVETDGAKAVSVSVGGASTEILSPASETDGAKTVSILAGTAVVQVLGQPVETDEAKTVSISIGGAIVEILGQPVETDEAKAVSISAGTPIVQTLGQPAETDSAPGLTVQVGSGTTLALGRSNETNAAFSPTILAGSSITVALSKATEVDSSQPVTVAAGLAISVVLVRAVETNEAQAVSLSLGGQQFVVLGKSSETDIAEPIIVAQVALPGLVGIYHHHMI